MLAVTTAAAEAISALTAEEGQQNNGGLRFSVHRASEDSASLALSVADAPAQGDQVVTSDAGAQVFMEPEAAAYLSDKLLDVQETAEGEMSFTVVQQG
jgi:iron-sulfur cluster assembly protein